ncbi:Mu-like prophage protein Com [Clostridium aceticum]|uniref:Mu-like prophage protein Com n=1 Tax=Clostridium aceticum TaxID=84022 RepID=A0A0G3W9I1_9CLOT|nr:Com family DNA-binding transcriptional regulator [Clostridium aceticum]AKL94998.1 Mu-like prophage protein Com [Clostridium aceticum]
METVKCKHCGRTLCELEGKIKIKCRKCGHWNYIQTKEAAQAAQSE